MYFIAAVRITAINIKTAVVVLLLTRQRQEAPAVLALIHQYWELAV